MTLNGKARAGGFPIRLASDQPGVAEPPAQVVVPVGADSARFEIQTRPVPAQTVVTIRASAGGVEKSSPLTVIPVGLRLSRTRAFAGESLLADLVLPAPAPQGAVVTFTSSDPLAARPTFPEVRFSFHNSGTRTAQAQIETFRIATPRTVVISATYEGTTWSATLEVLPEVLGSLTLPGQAVVSGGEFPGVCRAERADGPSAPHPELPGAGGRGGGAGLNEPQQRDYGAGAGDGAGGRHLNRLPGQHPPVRA